MEREQGERSGGGGGGTSEGQIVNEGTRGGASKVCESCIMHYLDITPG